MIVKIKNFKTLEKEGWKKIKDSNFNDIIHPNYSEFFTKEMQDQIIGKDIEVIKDNNNYKV